MSSWLSGKLKAFSALGLFPIEAIPNATDTITSQLHEGQITNPNAVLQNSCFVGIWHLKLPQVIPLRQVVMSENAKC